MTISYNKALGGAIGLAAFALAGGVLLGVDGAGGHTWQVATGGAMFAVGTIAGLFLLMYMQKLR